MHTSRVFEISPLTSCMPYSLNNMYNIPLSFALCADATYMLAVANICLKSRLLKPQAYHDSSFLKLQLSLYSTKITLTIFLNIPLLLIILIVRVMTSIGWTPTLSNSPIFSCSHAIYPEYIVQSALFQVTLCCVH